MDAFKQFEELRATAQHIEVVNRKLEKLAQVKADSWSQLLTATVRLWEAGVIGAGEISALHRAMRDGYGPGFSRVWDAFMPVKSTQVRWYVLDAPNGPNGSWLGTIPIGERRPAPPVGVPVVYVLFDAANEPVYVGSTDKFRIRLAKHRKEKPEAVSWTAFRCRSREHAYELEDRLLKQRKPRMNRRASR